MGRNSKSTVVINGPYCYGNEFGLRATRRSFVVALLSLTAGCGFTPVYSGSRSSDPSGSAALLSMVSISSIPDREGQILQNLLLDRFSPTGRSRDTVFKLSSQISIQESNIGTRIDATTTRSDLIVEVSSILSDETGGKSFQSRARSSFSTSAESDFATGVARDAAVERALRDIADDLRLQVATFLEKQRLIQGG